MPSDRWMRGWTRLSLFLSASCYSSCCCSSSRSRYVYLLCPSLPPSCSLITAVRQLCLGGSHSIVLAPPSPIGAPVGAGSALPAPPSVKGLASNHCDTWLVGALSRLRSRLSVSFLPGQRLQQSLQQTGAILLLLTQPVCLPLLHSNQIVEPSLKCLPASLSCHCRSVPCKWCLCFITTLLCTQLMDTFYHCSHLELFGEAAEAVIAFKMQIYTE